MSNVERLDKLNKIAKNVRANGALTTSVTIYDLEYLLSTVEEYQKEIERLEAKVAFLSGFVKAKEESE